MGGGLRLRHVAYSAERVVKLGRRGGDAVSGESPVLVVGRRGVSTAGGSISGSGGGSAARVATSSSTSTSSASAATAELAQKLVLVLDAPFTPAQLLESQTIVIITR